MGLLGFIGFLGFLGFIGLLGFIIGFRVHRVFRFLEFIGFMGFIGLMGFIGFLRFIGLIGPGTGYGAPASVCPFPSEKVGPNVAYSGVVDAKVLAEVVQNMRKQEGFPDGGKILVFTTPRKVMDELSKELGEPTSYLTSAVAQHGA